MGINYATVANRNAYLSSDFGEQMARRYFNDEDIEKLGRLTRGKNKGRLRGQIMWKKVEKGGWVSDGPGEGNGHVERRKGKVIWAALATSPWGQEPEIIKTWFDGQEEIMKQAQERQAAYDRKVKEIADGKAVMKVVRHYRKLGKIEDLPITLEDYIKIAETL